MWQRLGAGVVVAAGESAEAQALLGKVVAVFGSGWLLCRVQKSKCPWKLVERHARWHHTCRGCKFLREPIDGAGYAVYRGCRRARLLVYVNCSCKPAWGR